MKTIKAFFAVYNHEQSETRKVVLSFALFIGFIVLVCAGFVWFAEHYANTLK